MPVNPGPFQTIVEVGWSTKPRLLILRCRYTPTFAAGYNFTARIVSELANGEMRFGIWRLPGEGIQVQNVLGEGSAQRDIGRSTGKTLGLTGVERGMALAFDLAAVREAFLAATEETTGGAAFPAEIAIEVSGATFDGAPEDREPLPLNVSATLHRGGRGEYVELYPGPAINDWSALEVSSVEVFAEIDTTLDFNTDPGEEASNFGRGLFLDTLYVGLEEMTLRWESAGT